MKCSALLTASRCTKVQSVSGLQYRSLMIYLITINLSMGANTTTACEDDDGSNHYASCAGTDLCTAASLLKADIGDSVGRFIVKVLTSPGETTEAIERRAKDVATALRQDHTLMAEPIAGPLIVVEMSEAMLRQLRSDPRIARIERDTPEPPNQ